MEFSVGDAIKRGWEIFKSRPWILIGAALILFFASLFADFIAGFVDGAISGPPVEPVPGEMPEMRPVATIISWMLSVLISMGGTSFFLKAYDDPQGVKLEALWHPNSFLNYLLAYILVTIAVIIGLFLFVIPGVIVGLMLAFTLVAIIDRDIGAIDAMKLSKELTSGHKWKLLGFFIVLALLNLLGLLALGVGLLVTTPITALAFMHVYRLLGGGAVARRPADATL